MSTPTCSFTLRGSTSGAQTGRNWLLGACSQAAKLRTGCIARQRDMSTERSGVRMGTAVYGMQVSRHYYNPRHIYDMIKEKFPF